MVTVPAHNFCAPTRAKLIAALRSIPVVEEQIQVGKRAVRRLLHRVDADTLAGAWLADLHLFRADLRGQDLRGARLRSTNLREATLRGADLQGADLRNAADAAALNQIHRIAKVAPASLLHAALQDSLAGADSVDQRGAFFDRVRDRFFEIDVFTRGQGGDGYRNMPVVW